jgi:Relaxase/Mobilisation nuclease domain
MIVQTTRISREGGVQYLARHLLDKLEENDRVEILAGDRMALHDAQVLADVKRCKFSLRHLSISPEKEMSPRQLADFIRAIDAEFKVGPQRPRLIVRHIKHGRAHFHIVVAEVDPVSLRVLDCRNDFRRLEDLARRYEQDHGEHVQSSRTERRAAKVEGFSDVARKRAERTSASFDRTRLRTAFATGAVAFLAELKTQGLRITDGDKGPILVDATGVFVAAANRAAGVRKNQFSEFMEGLQNERLIGNQSGAPEHAGYGGTQHQAASAAPGLVGKAGWSRPDRAIDRIAPVDPRHAAGAGRGLEGRRRQARSPLPAVTGSRREDILLARISKELDDILRRARELAGWIASLFEPEADRLARQIEQARQKRKSFPPPAAVAGPEVRTYDLKRRTMP